MARARTPRVLVGSIVAFAVGAAAANALAFQEVVGPVTTHPAPPPEPPIHPRPPHPPREPIWIVPQIDARRVRERPVHINEVTTNVVIKDQHASTTLDLTLHNPSNFPQEARLVIPVPDGVTVRSMEWDGVGPEPTARVLPRDEARSIYDSIVRSMRDPALMEFVGYNLVQSSVFPLQPGASQHLKMTYEQVLVADGQRIDYVLPRSDAAATGDTKWTVNLTLESKQPILTVYSPSHELETKREGPGRVVVKIAGANNAQIARGAFRVSYLCEKPDTADLAASFFAYPDPSLGDGKGGYFLLLAAPPATQTKEERVAREVIIVLDRSGSMRGEKIEQAKAAATQVVNGLSDGEFFNIIDYSDAINSFSSAPVKKDKESAAKAAAYIARLEAQGGTNIHDAILEALRVKPTAPMPIVLFLTDGLPTVGERNEVKIREAAKKGNEFKRRIFTFGVGFDVNAPLLSHMAGASRAASTVVLPSEDFEVKVSQVFRRLKGPQLAFPKLVQSDTAKTKLREFLPRDLPDVFEGDQILILGQYNGVEPVDVRLTGDHASGTRDYTVRFDPTSATTRNGHVPRLWASAKIAMLIDEIRQAGSEGGVGDSRMKELTDEIVALSTKWGVLTEYTAFLATEGAERVPGQQLHGFIGGATRETLLRRAVESRTGSGGVSQQANIQNLADAAAPAASKAVAWKDADMQTVNVDEKLLYCNGQTLYRRQNRWVDALLLAKETEKPDREVEFGTDAYFKLADALAAEGRQNLLAQEGEILVLCQGERVLVKGPTP